MNERELRDELIATVRCFNPLGINQGTSGNASVRSGDGILITPSGLAYDQLDPADIVHMRFDGSFSVPRQGRKPSSEWRFHLDLLRERPDLNAIVHTHGVSVTTLACLGRGIPAVHYMIALAGGNDIRCAPYATFGTQELSDHALAAMRDRKACLLANHGLIAGGTSLAKALALAVEVETLAEIYWRALQIGEPVILSDTEIAAVAEKLAAGYGSAD
ncbi:class II aldolase/adducin family protein [Oceanibacterium hippocampi]|uniref:L-fuculose phosphate aldolase n=1 Tax=Oceanibacterium hippocampi TaxID=745714 RepID=A0A1Y5TUN0_9PROT|nr:class II aldolase/adducin family protein [Oceanibacterium hippocampi]SLN73022.1 L-fuculose phosphate aldolase [Oceanibacterium hippocampi]